MTAALTVKVTFPAEESFVRRAKTGLRTQGGEIEKGGFLDLLRQTAVGDRANECDGLLLKFFPVFGSVFSGVPSILEQRRVVVADRSGGLAGDASLRFSIGKVPSDDEFHGFLTRWGNG